MRGAINSALAIAYGKDKGGFDTFLKTLLPDDEHASKQIALEPTFAAHGIKAAPKTDGGGMDDWEEIA